MILLQLGTVQGDSNIQGFENWIACTQISWDLTREFKESAKAGTKDLFTGVADVKPITLNKTFDCSSPDLMQMACGSGVCAPQATIKLIASGGSDSTPAENVYCTFLLDSPIIASWNISGGEDERPTETVSLWYYKVQFTYMQSIAGGSPKPFGPRGWDRIGNKKWP